MSNVNSQLQSLAEGYNNNVTDYLSQMAGSKVQASLNEANDIASKITNTENVGTQVAGTLQAASVLGKSALKVKKVYDEYKSNTEKNPGDVKENVAEGEASGEGTELTDVAADTAAETTSESVGLTLAQFVPGLDVILDIGALGALGASFAYGLSKKHKEKVAENKYQENVQQQKAIENKTSTIQNVVAAPTQRIMGGVSSLD
tara:strand:+ start:134 stop:742 length:609 start_codon:yes stop_codon:yes gene_type:complete